MNTDNSSISLGTMVRGNGGKAAKRLEALIPVGFETYQIHWWADTGNEKLDHTADRVLETLEMAGNEDRANPCVSALGLYGNPLRGDSEGAAARRSIEELIDNASSFGCSMVGLFTGRLPGTAWRDSLPRFSMIFGDLCRRAADAGVKLAMENCAMDGDEASGDWNLAHGPKHWNRLFEALPPDAEEALGLEWEPAHQILLGNDPLEQLTTWAERIIHVHGKDAAAKSDGGFIQSLPGNGATSWDQVIRTLESAGYRGSIDIEGYHDPLWRGDKEIEGQQRSFEYLRDCRNHRCHGPQWAEKGDLQ